MCKSLVPVLLLASAALFADSIRVGSFNIRMPCDKDDNAWDVRSKRLIGTLNDIRYDIFGVQEAVGRQADFILRRTSYKAIGHGREANKEGESTRIFYDPKKFDLLEEHTFWLSGTPEKYSKDFGSFLPRIGTTGLFRDKRSGKLFVYANVHLEHRRAYETQKNQISVMLAKLRTYLDKKIPVILTGDFNAYSDRPAVKLAGSVMKDARLISMAKPEGPAGATFHGYEKDPGKRIHKDRIDYIFVSPGVKVLSFRTVDNFNKQGLASSDHFPIEATIELP